MTHVLILYPEMIPSVRLCGLDQFGELEKRGDIELKWNSIKNLTSDLTAWPDVVVFIRSDSWIDTWLAKKWRKTGRYLIYVLDDDLLSVPSGLSSSVYYGTGQVRNNIRNIMGHCHCLISPSRMLLEKYGKNFEKTMLLEEPAQLINCKKNESGNGAVRIGFAGSVDRSNDLDKLLDKAVGMLLEKYEQRIHIAFFGAKPAFIEKYGLEHIPYINSYDDYQKKMRELNWDIGLAPMPDTAFHSCKHYNKYIEYASCGIAGVYSDLYPYKYIIRDGENGLLCENTPESWVYAVSKLVEDKTLREKISEACIYSARTNLSVEHIAQEMKVNLGQILQMQTSRKALADLKIIQKRYLLDRIVIAVRVHRFRFPLVCIKKLSEKLTGKDSPVK